MTVEEFRFLTAPEGRRLLDCAAAIDGQDPERVARLHRSWDPRYCAAALTLVRLRRRAGRRVAHSGEYAPPLSFLSELRRITPNVAAKVSPAIDEAEIPGGCEVEFVSERGTCKEAVLWFGDFTTAGRRATLLPGGHTLTSADVPPVPVGPPKRFLYEPDRAVVRAHPNLRRALRAAVSGHRDGCFGMTGLVPRTPSLPMLPSTRPGSFWRSWNA